MSKLTIQIDIADEPEADGYSTQKLNRIDSTGSLARIAAANRGTVGAKHDDDRTVILKAIAAAAAAAEA